MRLTFIHQPSPSATPLGDWLLQHLEQDRWTRFDAAVAFVKHSGVRYIHTALLAFSQRASVRIIVGVDLCGTSRQGLEELLECVSPPNEVWVCHNRNKSTFHPKVYLFRSEDLADIVIGSGNLTEGGLFTNWEASLALSLDLRKAADRNLVGDIDRALDDWSDPRTGTSIQLTTEILQDMVDRGYVVSESEAQGAERTTADPPASAQSIPLFSSRRVRRPRTRSKGPHRAPPVMPPVTGSSLKAQQLRFWDQLISRSWELQSSVRPKTDPDKPHYISASAGRPGIRYGYSISRNGAFVQLSIDTDNKLRNEAMFDRLAAKEDEVKRDFGRPGLDFQRRDDQIGSYVVYKLGETWTPYDESSWPEIRDRLIEAMDLLYQAIQRHVRELID